MNEQDKFEAEIREQSRAIVKAEMNKDIEAIMPFWAEDAVVHMDNFPVVQGHEQIRSIYESMFQTMISLRSEIKSVTVSASGDMAYEMGNNFSTIQTDSGPMETASKYILVWRRGADGQWRCAAFSFTNNP